jgi:hypothetical protein
LISAGSSTLAITLRHSSSRSRWKTMPMSGTGPTTGVPPMLMLPPVGASRPAIRRSNVLLPQPLGPTMLTASPARSSAVSGAIARTPPAPPYVFSTRSRRIASAIAIGRNPAKPLMKSFS